MVVMVTGRLAEDATQPAARVLKDGEDIVMLQLQDMVGKNCSSLGTAVEIRNCSNLSRNMTYVLRKLISFDQDVLI